MTHSAVEWVKRPFWERRGLWFDRLVGQ